LNFIFFSVKLNYSSPPRTRAFFFYLKYDSLEETDTWNDRHCSAWKGESIDRAPLEYDASDLFVGSNEKRKENEIGSFKIGMF